MLLTLVISNCLPASDGPAPGRLGSRSRSSAKEAREADQVAAVETGIVQDAKNPKLKWKPYRPGKEPSQEAVVAGESTQPQRRTRSKTRRDVQPAVALEQPVKSRRAKLRDEILQVSAIQDDAFRDPFGDEVPNRLPAEDEMPDATEVESPDAAAEEMPGETEVPSIDEEPVPTDPLLREDLPEAGGDSIMSEEPLVPGAGQAEVSGCEDDQKDCAAALEALRASDISKIGLDITVYGVEGSDFPCECRLGNEVFEPRHWHETVFTWKASALCHKPLYFEDVHLERYGHSWNPLVQPLLSGAHFFASVPVLPYKMTLHPPDECVYSLGYYRPGNCAPYLLDPIPLSLHAGLVQAGVVVGGVLLFP